MLLIDVGNTKTAFAWAQSGRLSRVWRISTRKERLRDEYFWLFQSAAQEEDLAFDDSTRLMVCSVVPEVTEELARVTGDVRFVNHQSQISFSIDIDQAASLGADRIADAEAALSLVGAPVIVVDLGTATTLSVINKKRQFLGGLIAPGLGTATQALLTQAPALPRFVLQSESQLLGKNTIAAMRGGLLQGHIAMVKGLVQALIQEQALENAQVVVTGGALAKLGKLMPKEYRCVENLALRGLEVMARSHHA